MASESSELEKRIGDWEPSAQRKEMLRQLDENTKGLEELKKKVDILAGKIEG